MKHHGYNLKLHIRTGAVSAQSVGDAIGVSRQMVYNMYGDEDFSKTIIDKITKAKLEIPGVNAPGGVDIDVGASQIVADLQKQVHLLEQLVSTKDEVIVALRDALKTIKKAQG